MLWGGLYTETRLMALRKGEPVKGLGLLSALSMDDKSNVEQRDFIGFTALGMAI